MSLQTMEQQIGYILKALYEINISVQDFEKAKEILPSLLKKNGTFNNWTGIQVLRILIDKLGTVDAEEAISNLYYQYDESSVQEAGGFYEVYMLGKPMKSIEQLYKEQPVIYNQTEMECKECNSDDVIDFTFNNTNKQLCISCRLKFSTERYEL